MEDGGGDFLVDVEQSSSRGGGGRIYLGRVEDFPIVCVRFVVRADRFRREFNG